jgi:hypothetical protein
MGSRHGWRVNRAAPHWIGRSLQGWQLDRLAGRIARDWVRRDP